MVAVGVTVAACADAGEARQVSLANRVELPAVQTRHEISPSAPELTPLRVAITGLMTPSETLRGYGGFLRYLEERLGRPARLVMAESYAELNVLVQAQQVDLALVCPYPYIQGRRSFGMELLTAIDDRGNAEHYSLLVVPRESAATSLAHLQGRAFAFSDPDSNSGWLAPADEVARSGRAPGQFFGRQVFTRYHTESLRAVADHVVDGAAVDSLVYEYLASNEPELVSRTRVIARWGPYPSPPFVVHPNLDAELKRRLRAILLGMGDDPQGRQVLGSLLLDGFVATDDRAYDPIREMERRVRAATGLGVAGP